MLFKDIVYSNIQNGRHVATTDVVLLQNLEIGLPVREGLSLAIWFDIVEFRENIHMTVKIFANVDQLMFLVLKLVLIRIEYSLV